MDRKIEPYELNNLNNKNTNFSLPISVCIITKNEEKYIETCLNKLKKYNWEIIVTDTGSTDRTVDICKKYTNKIFHFDWINDFAAARNFCISKASNNWILSVDSDEYLINEQSEQELLKILTPCFSHPESAGMVDILNPQTSSGQLTTSNDPVARFFHKQYYSYVGKVHEQPMPVTEQKPSYFKSPFRLYHEGYANPEILHKKATRNISLLKNELEKITNDPYLYFQLGQSYLSLNDYENAYLIFQKGLELDVDPNLQYVKTMVTSYGYTMLHLKKYNEALSFDSIYDTFSNYADFVFLMGLIYMNNAFFDEAIHQFLHATKCNEYSVEGINSYLAYHNIGVIYECAGMVDEAKKYYDMSKLAKDNDNYDK
ncbi:MAG: glycosyltransferase [Lachnospiraceae bacterium]|nr:glycosyltransferase [Lachnospiraceae bacterium]